MDLTRFLLPTAFSFYLLAFILYLLHFKERQRAVAKGAFICIVVAFLLQTIVLGGRWISAGYLPVTNLFSTLFFFSWSLAAVYLYFELRYRIRAIGLFVIFLNLLLLGAALPRDPVLKPLVASLDTPLFTLHIVFSFVGYAFFAMAFSLGILYLLQRSINSPALPELHPLRRLNEEAIFLGFISFNLCMIFGAIWAYVAWGYYLAWNIKSLFSSVVWLYYAGMCHAKFVRRWQGSGYAALSIAGFIIVLFTYLGIGLLMSSNHPLD